MKNKLFLFLLFYCLSAGNVLAADQDQPITIEANNAQIDDQHGLSVYNGNVVIVQGSLTIRAAKVTAHHKGGGINEIVADGSPAHYEQEANAEDGIVKATANTIHYLADDKKVILMGDAKLEQKGNTIEGQNITYDMKRKVGNAASSAKSTKQENGRVKMIFQPKTLDKKQSETSNTK